ncbi:MAG: SAM-dependent methyltransferase [Kineosporiaceae bacterium]
MTTNDQGAAGFAAASGPPAGDHGGPQSARIYDYLLGGKDNYPPDRAVGDALIRQVPALPVMVRAQRAFLARAVRYLVGEAGVRQFLDIGTGIPTADNVHEVAQSLAPECRVLYVDNDPIVLAHARALMTSTPQGSTAFVMADIRDTDAVLGDPKVAATLDRDRPIALMLLGILHHLRDDDDPYGLVARLIDWLPSGSYVAIAGPGSDFDEAAMAAVAASAEASGVPYVARSRAQTEQFLAGLDLVEPGVVPIPQWRPDSTDLPEVFGWAVVARKP